MRIWAARAHYVIVEPIRFVFPAGDGGNALAICANTSDLRNLWRLFAHSGLALGAAATLSEAIHHLQGVSVVLCDDILPDGTWEQLLAVTSAMNQPPAVIVMSRAANEQLWAEVLNHGGFDLLPRPYSTTELHRVVVGAWRAWKSRRPALAIAGAA